MSTIKIAQSMIGFLKNADQNKLNNVISLVETDLSGIEKFDLFLKIISLDEVKDIYKQHSELEVILEKYILYHS